MHQLHVESNTVEIIETESKVDATGWGKWYEGELFFNGFKV